MILEHILKKDVLSLYEATATAMDALAKELILELYAEYEEVIQEARFQIVSRVRGGKVQRRRKVSAVSGYRFQDGKLVRMSPQEKMNRKRGQRRGSIHRQSSIKSALRRRKISIRKRGAI